MFGRSMMVFTSTSSSVRCCARPSEKRTPWYSPKRADRLRISVSSNRRMYSCCSAALAWRHQRPRMKRPTPSMSTTRRRTAATCWRRCAMGALEFNAETSSCPAAWMNCAARAGSAPWARAPRAAAASARTVPRKRRRGAMVVWSPAVSSGARTRRQRRRRRRWFRRGRRRSRCRSRPGRCRGAGPVLDLRPPALAIGAAERARRNRGRCVPRRRADRAAPRGCPPPSRRRGCPSARPPSAPWPIQNSGSLTMPAAKPVRSRGLDGPMTGMNRYGPSPMPQRAKVWP